MIAYFFSIANLIIVLSILTTSQMVHAKLYRWVDENGRIYYSDKVPPEYNKLRRESLSDKARVVEVKEAEKSVEQKLLEQRLENLRREQEKVIAEREAQDKVLLSTFRSEEDMRYAMQRKLQAIQAKQKVSEANLQRLEYKLLTQQKEAAGFERDGKQVPEKLLAEIKDTETQRSLVNVEINRHLRKIEQVKQTFDKDMERFIFLKKKWDKDRPITDEELDGPITPSMLGLFTCDDERHCHSAWDIARVFLRNYSTTVIELDSDKLVMTAEPLTDNDISLSLSRIKDVNGKLQIFLDIHCRASALGDTLCQSLKVHDIRSAFAPFIQIRLAADQ